MHVCAPCAPSTRGSRGQVSDPLELELELGAAMWLLAVKLWSSEEQSS